MKETLGQCLNLISQKKIVIPLFRDLGYSGIRYTHGISEYGMDVVCYENTKVNAKRYVGIQVKIGNIGGTRSVQEIIAQAKASFNVPYLDISSQIQYQIGEYYVVTSGKITENAKKQIINGISEFSGIIKFLDGESIFELLYKNQPKNFDVDYKYYFELLIYKLNEKYDDYFNKINKKNILLCSYLDKYRIYKNCVINYIKLLSDRNIKIGSQQFIELKKGQSIIIFKRSWRDDLAIRYKDYTELEDLMYSLKNKSILNISEFFNIMGEDYQAFFFEKGIETLSVDDVSEIIFRSQLKTAEFDVKRHNEKEMTLNEVALFESDKIEFKQEMPNSSITIAQILSSFANTDGGDLYIGIDDQRFFVGVEDIDKIQLRINGIARNVCEPPLHPRYEIITKDGKNVLRVSVLKSNTIHRVKDGKYYTRIGPSSVELSVDELESLILKKYNNRIGLKSDK